MRLFPMWLLLLAALAAPLAAQPAYRVVDPVVAVDDQRVDASVARDSSGHLTIAVPGDGTYTVSVRPFDGAQRGGQFEGPLLSFAVEGRSVRLVSSAPILPSAGLFWAYVLYAPAGGPGAARVDSLGPGAPPSPAPAADADRPPADDAAWLEGQALLDRLALLDQLAEAQAERDRLAVERDRLAREVDRLRALQGTPPADAPEPPATSQTPRGERPVSLPGFDWTRLDNPDAVRERLAEAPAGAAGGDVVVLFQADASGRVVRTAVPSPRGDGLDAWAEQVVGAMRFRPPVVDGQPTGLRSQVVVRFGR